MLSDCGVLPSTETFSAKTGLKCQSRNEEGPVRKIIVLLFGLALAPVMNAQNPTAISGEWGPQCRSRSEGEQSTAPVADEEAIGSLGSQPLCDGSRIESDARADVEVGDAVCLPVYLSRFLFLAASFPQPVSDAPRAESNTGADSK